MPKFKFNGTEKEALIQFLKEVDKTGYYPNTNTKIQPNGWVLIKYKNENHGK
jgi:nitric oxide reductase subunit C